MIRPNIKPRCIQLGLLLPSFSLFLLFVTNLNYEQMLQMSYSRYFQNITNENNVVK